MSGEQYDRFMVIAYSGESKAGGLSDCIDSFEDQYEALAFACKLCDEFVSVFDRETGSEEIINNELR